jgi:hypothetical protein
MISVENASANWTATAVLPTAVGPAITTRVLALFSNPGKIRNPVESIGAERFRTPLNGQFFLSFGFKNIDTMIKYTIPYLTKLEDMIAESDYTLRYEKGNFKSGYCVLKDQKIIIINKFYTTEGKINALLEILKGIALDQTRFTDKSKKLHEDLIQQFQAA